MSWLTIWFLVFNQSTNNKRVIKYGSVVVGEGVFFESKTTRLTKTQESVV